MIWPRKKNKQTGRSAKSARQQNSTGVSRNHTLASALALIVVLGAGVYGLEQLTEYVYGQPEYNPQVKVKLDQPPDWIVREGWEPRILSTIELSPNQQWQDQALVRQISDQLADSGWVLRVKHINQDRDGTVRVACDYRRPVAMVLTDQGYIPVDKETVRLPEVYNYVDEDSGWIRIIGTKSIVPEVGRPFEEDDVVGAVRIASLVFEQEYAHWINGIDISNFGGRHDNRRSHIRLLTVDGSRIDWGSAIGEEIAEASITDKLRSLALLFKRQMPQARLDVSTYRDACLIGPLEPAAIQTVDASGNEAN